MYLGVNPLSFCGDEMGKIDKKVAVSIILPNFFIYILETSTAI